MGSSVKLISLNKFLALLSVLLISACVSNDGSVTTSETSDGIGSGSTTISSTGSGDGLASGGAIGSSGGNGLGGAAVGNPPTTDSLRFYCFDGNELCSCEEGVLICKDDESGDPSASGNSSEPTTGLVFDQLRSTGYINLVQAKDLTGDGAVELIGTNKAATNRHVVIHDGVTNEVIYQQDLNFRAAAIETGDIDSDSLDDIILSGVEYGSGRGGQIAWIKNLGGGSFSDIQYELDGLASDLKSMKLVDIDQDGDLDLIVAEADLSRISVYKNSGADVWSSVPVHYSTASSVWDMDVKDLNGDGHLDVLYGNRNAATVGFLINMGDGEFLPIETEQGRGAAYAVKIADMNNDGIEDVLATNRDHLRIYKGIGNNEYERITEVQFTSDNIEDRDPADIEVGDFNGDGNLDVVGLSQYGLYIFYGEGGFGFSKEIDTLSQCTGTDVVVQDLNQDDLIDILIPQWCQRSFSMYLQVPLAD